MENNRSTSINFSFGIGTTNPNRAAKRELEAIKPQNQPLQPNPSQNLSNIVLLNYQ